MADPSSNYKLLISDYDGTLVGPDHEVSEKVKTSVKKWQENKKSFTLATGRSYLMIKDVCQKLKLKTPIITSGGAEIIDVLTEKAIYSKNIEKKTLKNLVKLLLDNNFEVSVESTDTLYSNHKFSKYFPYLKYKSLEDFVFAEAPKIVAYSEKDEIGQKEKYVEDFLVKKFPELHIIRIRHSNMTAWDITSEKATKHLAVLELMKILNIKPEEAAAVGDGYNDYPLLTAVGFKAAMGNAIDELKAIADIVVPSQEDDGVAHLINKLLKKN